MHFFIPYSSYSRYFSTGGKRYVFSSKPVSCLDSGCWQLIWICIILNSTVLNSMVTAIILPVPQPFFPSSFQKPFPGDLALSRARSSFSFHIHRAFHLGVEGLDFIGLVLIGVLGKDTSLTSKLNIFNHQYDFRMTTLVVIIPSLQQGALFHTAWSWTHLFL